jgi:hypothetical protein
MRLYFHVRERGSFIEDDQGADFESLEQAREEAIVSAREMMAERIITGRPINDVVFEISDESGKVMLSFPWDDALVRV